MNTVLILMSNAQWTTQAVHLGCALARNNSAQVVLLRLIRVRHPSYLGTEFGDSLLSEREYQEIKDYTATAEDYGIKLAVESMQYVTYPDALIDAAAQLGAEVVFAEIPESRIPYWRRFQHWTLERRLAGACRRLFTLDRQSAAAEAPGISIRPAASPASK